MATIAIKDLPEGVDLDRQAMLAITGGARFAQRQNFPAGALTGSLAGLRSARIINYPGGFPGQAVASAGGQSPGNKSHK